MQWSLVGYEHCQYEVNFCSFNCAMETHCLWNKCIPVNKGETNEMQQLVILLVIKYSSTCFRHLYAHHQEVRLRFTAYGFLSCCSCWRVRWQAVCTVWSRLQRTPHSAHSLPPDSPHITTATTGQKTIGSETQSDLLMMGVQMHETCWGTIDY